jgi:GT2 family glycosyltransferase
MTNVIDIVIVNWNSGEQLMRCLTSIMKTVSDVKIISRVVVVDNASSDNSTNGIELVNLPIMLITNSANCGFAYACNQGASNCTSKFILFLNPDTELLKDTLSKAIGFMEDPHNSSVGIMGAQLLDETGKVSATCARYPTVSGIICKIIGMDRLFPNLVQSHFMIDWDHSHCRDVDQVMGAFFLIRRELFESLSGFDERFFVYFEEVDLSLRARQAGWRSCYFPDAQAFHKGGGTSEQVKSQRLFYSLRSRILYGYKHFSCLSATIIMIVSVVFEPLSRIVLCAFNKSYEGIVNTIRAYVKLWISLPSILKIACRDGSK